MYKKLLKRIDKEIDKIIFKNPTLKLKDKEEAKEIYLRLHILLNCISEPIYRAAGNIAYDFDLYKKDKNK